MKKLLLLFALLTTIAYPQLKEMEIKPTELKGAIPVFTKYMDMAAVVFYAQFDNLTFDSNWKIVHVYNRSAGNYAVIIEPKRQTLEISSAGFKTELLRIPDISARECLYYTVEPKKDTSEVQGVKELAVTIQSNPADARITIDGKEVQNNTATFFTLGKHTLKVEKTGFLEYTKEIEVSTANTLFQVTLGTNDPVEVTIDSEPQDAKITIDGFERGNTKKSYFLYPKVYELNLSLKGYLAITEKITVSPDAAKNNFKYTLLKNSGKLAIEVSPSNATVTINRELINGTQEQELPPGTYQIEAQAEGYKSAKKTINLERGKREVVKFSLERRNGKLQFAINPREAESVLKSGGEVKYSWQGLKIISEIGVGNYELTSKYTGYKTVTKRIEIKENETTIEEVELLKEEKEKEKEKVNVATGNFVYVEGGSFNMGSNEGGDDEKPIHRVTVKSFKISKTELTVKEYRAYCSATGTKMPETPRWGWNDADPIVNVNWNDAQGYCKWAKVRLPTEAEWEYAARGGNKSKGYKYSGSDNIDNVASYDKNSNNKVHQVGTKQPNELGLYDMSGNVWEWCSDFYNSDYYKSSPENNPKGPNSGVSRVLRGGSWSYNLDDVCRVAARYDNDSEYRLANIGLRVVED